MPAVMSPPTSGQDACMSGTEFGPPSLSSRFCRYPSRPPLRHLAAHAHPLQAFQEELGPDRVAVCMMWVPGKGARGRAAWWGRADIARIGSHKLDRTPA